MECREREKAGNGDSVSDSYSPEGLELVGLRDNFADDSPLRVPSLRVTRVSEGKQEQGSAEPPGQQRAVTRPRVALTSENAGPMGRPRSEIRGADEEASLDSVSPFRLVSGVWRPYAEEAA